MANKTEKSELLEALKGFDVKPWSGNQDVIVFDNPVLNRNV